MKQIASVIAIAGILPMVGWCQAGTSQPNKTGCEIREVFDREGWAVPGLSKVKIISSNARWTTNGAEGVFVDTLKPDAPETSVMLVTCLSGRTDRVEVRNQLVNVIEILRFHMNRRVFAYRVTAQLMGIESKGIRVPLASEMVLTFYDNNGSGRFTIMQYPGSSLIPGLDVPVWVKTAVQ